MRLRALLILTLLCGPAWAAGRGADGRFSERASAHFQLAQDVDIDRYTGVHGSRQFERGLLEVLEGAYREFGDALAIRPRSKISVVVYDPSVFDARFSQSFGFRAAGFFDGVVHVRGATRVDQRLVATLRHEYVHAALHQASAAVFPAWLNEGLAEHFEALTRGKRHLSYAERGRLVQSVQRGEWIPIAELGIPSFQHLSADRAELAYLESYAVVEHLVRRSGMRKLRRLSETLMRTRNVERALDRTYRKSLAEIEVELLAELR